MTRSGVLPPLVVLVLAVDVRVVALRAARLVRLAAVALPALGAPRVFVAFLALGAFFERAAVLVDVHPRLGIVLLSADTLVGGRARLLERERLGDGRRRHVTAHVVVRPPINPGVFEVVAHGRVALVRPARAVVVPLEPILNMAPGRAAPVLAFREAADAERGRAARGSLLALFVGLDRRAASAAVS